MNLKKERVLINYDYLTKKVLDVKPYYGDGKGVSYFVDDSDFLKKAEARGMDVFFIGKKFIERPKKEDYFTKQEVYVAEIKRLKALERVALTNYIKSGYDVGNKKNLMEISAQKAQVSACLKALREERAYRIEKRIKARLKRTNFKYYASICLIIRNDHEYLEEWLRWHVGQGVEHFYIYDHASEPSIKEFAKALPDGLQERLTIIDFSQSHDFAQHDAYNHCLKKFGRESRWIGYVDSDEMVRVVDGTDLKTFLKDFEDNAGLFIGWKTYGANGQRYKSDLPVRERFPTESKSTSQQGLGKVFVQPYYMRQMLTHNGYTVDGYSVVDENKAPVEDGGAWQKGLTTDKICIDHYYTKSYEEWLAKISRGTCDPYFNRRYEEFFLFNPDLAWLKEESYPVQVYEAHARSHKQSSAPKSLKNKQKINKKNDKEKN